MADTRRGPLLRFIIGIWNTLNFARRLVLNLVFLAILVFVLAAIFQSRPALQQQTALVLDLEGAIVEQYSTAATERALDKLTGSERKEIQLRDILRTIDAAARDARIGRIVLIPDNLTAAGPSTLREVGQALDRFRQAGKPVTTIANDLGQGQFFLAAHSDQILLDPEGGVVLTGFASYQSYFKDALDKLGVTVHLIKVGEYKSAAEPFVLNQASEAAKRADREWMGDLWREYVTEVATLRKIDPARLEDDIARYDERLAAHQGDLAALALDQKLVDRIATRAEARQWLREQGVPAEGDSFRQVDWQQYYGQLPPELPASEKLAVIVAEGTILPGNQPQGSIGGSSTAQLIRGAREDETVKALVLRVSSPGGDSVASEMIRREIEQTRAAGKPVVVSMGDYAASGGYWISMNADEIFAQPTTITGSIGIFGLFPRIPDTLAKIGIHTDGIGTTPLAGAFDIRQPLSPQVESILTSVIGRGYQQFIGRVAEARNRTPEQIDAVAQGHVWTGNQALERGLVDKLGGLDEAIAAAAARAGLPPNVQVSYVERPLSAWDRLALSLSSSQALAGIASQTGLHWPAALLPAQEMRQAATVLDSLRGRRFGMFAHCFCELR
ncbi:signal peptide peptidase SppA [Dokdonella koreensis]|uniref:Signal peptide peptidase SppA n=1 Tax=Dokdonella koreensis DS-123 TaxID=1300342 RepID=A0A167H0P2_9GAMM|nr:signal peptide peptidase SppA [Dokdonella koreensis]ANB18406.1 Signal peptide peptidase SppA [Dokdonella koreensis DS-123]